MTTDTDRSLLVLARDALFIGRDLAAAEQASVSERLNGYLPHKHAAAQRDLDQITAALAAVDAHLSAALQASQRSTGHGHVVPRPDGVRVRCGGPAICKVCQREQAALTAAPQASEPAAPAAGEVADNLSDAERLAFALCEEAGDDPHTLEWEGNPPEPWGDRWMRYLPQARRLVALLSATKPAPTPPADIVRDAERYRWLRTADGVPISSKAARDPVAYDAAIDAAIAASKGAQQ